MENEIDVRLEVLMCPHRRPLYAKALCETRIEYDIEQMLREIRQRAKRPSNTPNHNGGPLELREQANYFKLRTLALYDMTNLSRTLPADHQSQQAEVREEHGSIPGQVV